VLHREIVGEQKYKVCARQPGLARKKREERERRERKRERERERDQAGPLGTAQATIISFFCVKILPHQFIFEGDQC
jgi:hypothetical protein